MVSDQPDLRTRDFMARLSGLGKPVLHAMALATVASTAAAIAAGAWAIHRTATSADQIKRYVVYVDAQTNPVRTAQIDAEWTPARGAYVDFAQNWIRSLRSRPLDQQTLVLQRRKVIWTTDQRVYGQLQESMRVADEVLRRSALDVETIAANLIEAADDRAVVLVRWTERERSSPGTRPTPYTGTITVTYKPPAAQAEFDRNPLGMFVTAFQTTETTQEGPAQRETR